MANVFGQLRDFFRAPRLDEALIDLAPKQVTPQTRTSWVFDSHVMTEASGSRGGKDPQAVSLAWDEDRWNIDSSAKNSWTGMTHRERKETLLQIFLANPWASNCIDTIALYIISGGLTIEPRVPNPDKSQRKKIEQLLLRINEDWDFNQYVYDALTDEMIFGETFTEYTMASGAPYQLFSIDCITMDTEHDRYGRALRYKQQLTSTSKVNYLDPKTIIRWWNPHKRAKVDPFSPLERIQDAILLDKKMVNWTTTFFQKGAKFPYSIEFQGDKDEADRFLVWYKQNYTGEKNAHLPPVTYNGAKINPSGKGSIDIDFDRGLDRQQMIVLSAFHVPPSIACIAESGNRLTDMSDGQRKILQYIACDPRRHQFFEKFNYRLIRPYFGEDYYVSTRYADFRDDKSLAEVADIRVKNGTLTQNEVRQEMGKEAYVKGGDIPVIITPKEVTPVPRLDDLENEQRITAKQALDAGDLNNEMLKAKVEQAKNPPPPMLPGQPPQNTPQGDTNDKNAQGQGKTNTNQQKKSGKTAGSESVSTGEQIASNTGGNEPGRATFSNTQSGRERASDSRFSGVSLDTRDGLAEAEHNTGMMLAFMLDAPTAEQLAIPGGEPASDLHITLAYLGDMEDEPDGLLRPHTSPDKIKEAIASLANDCYPLSGCVGGLGRFKPAETEEDPVIALVDVPGLAEFRTKFVNYIRTLGYFVADNHGYTPHITLAYIPQSVPSLPLNLDTVMLCIGDERIPFRLGGAQESLTQEYNQNHDAHGRFGSGSGGGDSSGGGASGDGKNFNQMSISEKEAFLAQHGGDKWEASLSESESHSIQAYTWGKYEAMNDALRKGQYGLDNPERIDAFNHNATQALLKSSAPADMTVLRRVGSEMYEPFSANVGKHFVEKGFCSTTINSDVSSEYGDVSMHIRLPQGSPGAYMGNFTPDHFKDNREWLLPPNAKFKIVHAWADAGGNKHVALEYTGQHTWG